MKEAGLFLWRIIVNKIIIFGAGPTGLRTYSELKGKNEIVAFFDNDEEKTGSIVDGITVFQPTKAVLEKLDFDQIVIASVYGKWEIKKQLQELDVADEKIEFHAQRPDVFSPFLKNLAQEFNEEKIIGDCAEVGVFRGESARKINNYFSDRKLHLYDTFEGFSAKDTEIEHQFGRKNVKEGQFKDTSIDIVMQDMKYPQQIIIHKGYFPDTAQNLSEKFCFVRIDLDLYEPTRAALDIFEPLMVRGGIMLVHDYFGEQYPGIKKVVKQFMHNHPSLSKLPIGDLMTIAIVGF